MLEYLIFKNNACMNYEIATKVSVQIGPQILPLHDTKSLLPIEDLNHVHVDSNKELVKQKSTRNTTSLVLGHSNRAHSPIIIFDSKFLLLFIVF